MQNRHNVPPSSGYNQHKPTPPIQPFIPGSNVYQYQARPEYGYFLNQPVYGLQNYGAQPYIHQMYPNLYCQNVPIAPQAPQLLPSDLMQQSPSHAPAYAPPHQASAAHPPSVAPLPPKKRVPIIDPDTGLEIDFKALLKLPSTEAPPPPPPPSVPVVVPTPVLEKEAIVADTSAQDRENAIRAQFASQVAARMDTRSSQVLEDGEVKGGVLGAGASSSSGGAGASSSSSGGAGASSSSGGAGASSSSDGHAIPKESVISEASATVVVGEDAATATSATSGVSGKVLEELKPVQVDKQQDKPQDSQFKKVTKAPTQQQQPVLSQAIQKPQQPQQPPVQQQQQLIQQQVPQQQKILPQPLHLQQQQQTQLPQSQQAQQYSTTVSETHIRAAKQQQQHNNKQQTSKAPEATHQEALAYSTITTQHLDKATTEKGKGVDRVVADSSSHPSMPPQDTDRATANKVPEKVIKQPVDKGTIKSRHPQAAASHNQPQQRPQQHQPTQHQQQQQQPPQQPQLQQQQSTEDHASEWQETKRNRKKKQNHQQQQNHHHQQQQQQQQAPHKQLKASSSNGVKQELTKQTSNPLPTPATATTPATSAPTTATTAASVTAAPAVVWPSKPSQNYKRHVVNKSASSPVEHPAATTTSEAKVLLETRVPEAKVVEGKGVEGSSRTVTETSRVSESVEKKVVSVEMVKKGQEGARGVEEVGVKEGLVVGAVEKKGKVGVVDEKVKLVEDGKRIEEERREKEKKEEERREKEKKEEERREKEKMEQVRKEKERKEEERREREKKEEERREKEREEEERREKEQERRANELLKKVEEAGKRAEEASRLEWAKVVEGAKKAEEARQIEKLRKEEEEEVKIMKRLQKELVARIAAEAAAAVVDKSANKLLNTQPPPAAATKEITGIKHGSVNVKVSKDEDDEEEVEKEGGEELEDGEIVDDDAADDDDDGPLKTPKYTYEEGQWSPFNQSGKKVYNRCFLLQVRGSSIKRPNLPPLEIVLSQPNVQRQDSAGMDFSSYFKSSSASQSKNYAGNNRRGNSNNNPNLARRQFSNEQVGRRVINLNLQKEVTLHTAENAWSKTKEETSATKELGKKFRSILNKLTPQRFEKLAQQALEMDISTVEQLKNCIEILFEKAIVEPSFAVLYAKIAKVLSKLTISEAGTQTAVFSKHLISKCQTEFEKDKQDEADIADLQSSLEEAVDEKEKKRLSDELEVTMWKAKKRSLGNIKFIGELFKLGMLRKEVMDECLAKLLQQQDDEDSLECLCQLFTTIGRDIDKDDMSRKVATYLATLQEMVKDKRTSARIRFMICDVLDLKKNDWKPRFENNPKTIEQVHKEARMEEMEKQQKLAELGQRRKYDEQHRPQMKVPTMQDGWSNVAKPPKGTYDAKKFKLVKACVDEHTKLGPPVRGWGRGSMGTAGSATPAKPAESKRLGGNRYALLSSSMEATDRPEAGHQAASNEVYRTLPKPHLFSTSQEKPTSTEVAAALPPSASTPALKVPFGASQSASHAATTIIISGSSSGNRKAEKKMSEEEVEKKTRSITDEFLHLNDLREALECIESELFVKEDASNGMLFLFHSLVLNIERSVKVREQVGLLHRNILVKKMLPMPCCYSVAVRKLVAFAEDAVIDIPQVWDYIGQIVCPIFLENSSIPLSILLISPGDRLHFPEEHLEQTLADSEAKLFAHVLNALKHHLGHFTVKEMWEASEIKWTSMLPADKLKDFIKKHGLEYTQEEQLGGRRHRLISVNEDKNKLIELYKRRETTVEQVHDWIHEFMYISTSGPSSPADLKSTADVCTALCMASLTKQSGADVQYALDEERFTRFLSVLRAFTAERHDRQLALLLGLQELIHRLEHPPNLLLRLFELLLDADVVVDAAFHQWHDDASNSPGKGIALQSVTRFFDWLKEDEKDSQRN